MAAGLGWWNEIDIERVVEIPSDVKEHAPARFTVQQRMRRTYNGLSPRVASSRGEGREGGPVAEAGALFLLNAWVSSGLIHSRRTGRDARQPRPHP
jgi:hypothetical protein